MRRNSTTFGLVAAASAVALVLAGAAVAALAAHGSARAARVVVVEKEYSITVTPKTLKAGLTLFVVENRGKLVHALDISGPGLPTVKVAKIAPGKSRSVTVRLGGGTFKLWCPIPGHAALGMVRTLPVSSTTGSSGGAGVGNGSGGTSTSSGDAWG